MSLHSENLADYAGMHGYRFTGYRAEYTDDFAKLPIVKLDSAPLELHNHIQAEGWQYAEYRREKAAIPGRSLLSFPRDIYTAIVAVDLHKPTPDILLDSSKTQGYQLHRQYKGDKVTLSESPGSRGTRYHAFAPSIDGKEPQVLISEELRKFLEQNTYDIQVQGNKLYIYGPVYFSAGDVEKMIAWAQKGAQIFDRLDRLEEDET